VFIPPLEHVSIDDILKVGIFSLYDFGFAVDVQMITVK